MRASAVGGVIMMCLSAPAWAQVGSVQVPVGAPGVAQIAPVGNIQPTHPLPGIQLTPQYQPREGCRPTVDDPSCKTFDFDPLVPATIPAIRYPGDIVADRLGITRTAQVWLKVCLQNVPACRTAPTPRQLDKDMFEHFDGIESRFLRQPRQTFYLTWSLLRDDNTLSGARSTLFLITVK